MRLTQTCPLLIVLLSGTTALGAQDSTTGIVFDSLRFGRPLPRMAVTILGTSSRAITDSGGRFTFHSVPNGDFVVAAWSPWLDTLGIPFLHRTVKSGQLSGIVELATPSLQTFQLRRCGTLLGHEQGVLSGETRTVDGTGVAEQLVWAEWSEYSTTGQDLRESLVATMDTSDGAGGFTLCGVPLHRTVVLRAVGDSTGSGMIQVDIKSLVQRHDILVGGPDERFEIRGIVVQAATPQTTGDSSVEGAEVQLHGDPRAGATTGADGRFHLTLPQRSSTVSVRAIGYRQVDLPVPTHLPSDSLWTIRIERTPQSLEAVSIVADAFARERSEFDQRRSTGMGRFITDEMLERLPLVTPNAIASMVPGIAPSSGAYPALKIRGSTTLGFCDPRIFEDGLDLGQMTTLDERVQLRGMLQRAKRIEIYKASLAPAKFNDNDGCGAVVIWTR